MARPDSPSIARIVDPLDCVLHRIDAMRTHLLLPSLALLGFSSTTSAAKAMEFVNGTRLPAKTQAIVYGGRTQGVLENAKGRDPSFLSYQADDREPSGWMLQFAEAFDLSAQRDSSVLELRLRPGRGGGKIYVGFVDDQGGAIGAGVQSRHLVSLPDTAKGWTTVRVPLWQFPPTGVRWDPRTKSLSSGKIDWKRIREFRISTDKGANAAAAGAEGIARVDVALASIVPVDASSTKPDIDARGLGAAPGGPSAGTFFLDGEPAGSWDYSYGGATDALVVDDPASGRAIFVYRGDDREYSGWSIHLPRTLDLQSDLSKGALEFRVRGTCGGERLVAGLIDDESDGPDRKTQARVSIQEYGTVTKEWQTLSIPLSAFGKRGMWWDAARGLEIDAAMDWSRIQEFRISSDRGANRACRDASGRFSVQIADVRIIPLAIPVWDAAAHWKSFHSDKPSEIARDSGESSKLRTSDWSRHLALEIAVASGAADRMLRAEIVDSSGESWIAGFAVPKGSTKQFLPLCTFQRAWPQPAGAFANRRFDLERVRSFSLSVPGSPAATVVTGTLRLVNDMGPQFSTNGIRLLRANLLGWSPQASKRFFFAAEAREFALLDSTGKAATTGSLSPVGFWDASGDSLWTGDFSRWTRPGTYRIAVGQVLSDPFRIGEDVYDSLFSASVRAFYFQRDAALDPALAGPWAHMAGHADTSLPVMEARDAPGTWSAPGGWYDAGDYGKYVVNAGISVGTLLLFHELLPQVLPDRSLRIPESGNGRNDLLDEVLWEMRWLERMQDRDGGVFFKVAGRRWSDFVQPENDTVQRWVIGKTIASTLDYAAMMAQTSRLVRASDAKLSARYLGNARKAWEWARKNPSIPAPSETGGSGGYNDDQMSDEFLWAAVEIWRASGAEKDRAEVRAHLKNIAFTPAPTWAQVQDLALLSLALSGKDSLARWAAARVEELSDSIHLAIDGNAARIPVSSFIWGSNSLLLNHGMMLAVSHHLTGSRSRLEDLQEMIDYTLGRNALATSFVIGFGVRAPRHPHHRLVSGRDAIPGFLSGGPNQDHQDDILHNPYGVLYPWREPARSWLDQTGSYASNEVCINWNASLAFAVGYLSQQGRK